ncbi:MAG: bifunctional riboflavin kinase/FMN adenylyltransferase [Prevotellaceae bacterium]|nr:bifunctional riboflavin kinase/FMN adenylyltransferase [Prevotellaceae bacterium]
MLTNNETNNKHSQCGVEDLAHGASAAADTGSSVVDKGLSAGVVATIGFFDGVHRGHRYLIDKVMEMAHAHAQQSMVITFDRHPREVLQSDYQPQMLTTLNTKLRLLRETGVDRVEVLHFTRELAALSAREFMAQVLKERLGVTTLVIGYDHRFGHNRAEGFDDYVRYGKELGIEVVQNSELTILAEPCPPVSYSSEAPVASSSEAPNASSEVASSVKESSSSACSFSEKWGKHVSSSAIRRLLKEGNVSRANLFLDRPYTITGCVTHGFAEGRKMGFPTANLDTTGYSLLIPANGVYGVWVKIGCADAVMGKCEVPNHDGWLPAMLNIGMRPTFDGSATTIEANIFDFNDDIYGQPMTIAFCFRLRNEQRFDSVEALENQLHKDRKEIEKMLTVF